jgi:predicted Zn-dependent protease
VHVLAGNFPTRQRCTIYLVPLDGDGHGAPPAKVFADLLRRWFLLEVSLLKAPTKAVEALERDARGCGYGSQIECPSAHELLYSIRPRDAFIVLGYTMEDICNTAKGFGFLFGEADLDKGVGLFSFARYSDGVDRSSPRFLRRCGMVLCHEATHCFGVRHCVYASCIMNGSNHLEESESRPFACCPIDVRKIQLTLDQAKVHGRDTPPIDLAARQRGLIEFFDEHGLADDARFARNVLGSLTGQPVPDPEPAAAPAAAKHAAKPEEQAEPPAPPPAVARQRTISELLEGVEIGKPLVRRQSSGLCAAGEESPRDAPMPAEVKRMPSHDIGLLTRAYA